MKKYWRTIHECLALKRGSRSHLSRNLDQLSREKNGISPARRGAEQSSARRKQDRQDAIKSESSEKNSGIIGVSGGGWLFQPADCRSRLREHDTPPSFEGRGGAGFAGAGFVTSVLQRAEPQAMVYRPPASSAAGVPVTGSTEAAVPTLKRNGKARRGSARKKKLAQANFLLESGGRFR